MSEQPVTWATLLNDYYRPSTEDFAVEGSQNGYTMVLTPDQKQKMISLGVGPYTDDFYSYKYGKGPSGFGGFGLERYPNLVPVDKTDTGGNDKPRPPKQDNTSNTPVPDASKEPLSMPNIDIIVKDEIERLTLELVEDVKDFLISDTADYESIDFFPDTEIIISKKANVSRDTFNDLVKYVMENIIQLSISSSPKYDYVKFLEYFEVVYTDTGRPTLIFKLENIDNFNLSSVRLKNVSGGKI